MRGRLDGAVEEGARTTPITAERVAVAGGSVNPFWDRQSLVALRSSGRDPVTYISLLIVRLAPWKVMAKVV